MNRWRTSSALGRCPNHEQPRISIVGLGSTGTRAARQLLEADPDLALTVYDIEPSRCEFRGTATLATSAREALAESDTVVLALPREARSTVRWNASATAK